TVWIAVAATRGSAAMSWFSRRTPSTAASRERASTTAPSRSTLSTTIRLPGRENLSARPKYSALFCLSASINVRSNGPSTPGRVARFERRLERGVGLHERVGDVAIDLVPETARHSARRGDGAEGRFEDRALLVVGQRAAQRLGPRVMRLVERALVVRGGRIGKHGVREGDLPRGTFVLAHVRKGLARVVQRSFAVTDKRMRLPQEDGRSRPVQLGADLG